MSITEEGTGPSNEPTTSINPKKPSSAPNAANQPAQGLPGLAAFGQMQGYQPVGSQPQDGGQAGQADVQPEAEPVPELIPAEPVVPHTEIPEQSYSVSPQHGGDHLVTEIDPFAPETDHPVPDYLASTTAPEAAAAPAPAAPVNEVPPAADEMQSFMHEPNVFDEAAFQTGQTGQEHLDAGALHQTEIRSPDIHQPEVHQPEVHQPEVHPADFRQPDVHQADIHQAEVIEPMDPAAHVSGAAEPGALQTFEATYDQHPEIPLGAFEQPGEPQPEEHPFLDQHAQQPEHMQQAPADADFLGAEAAAQDAESKGGRGRKMLIAGSGLVGVLALGGALAFAYKIGGDSDIAKAGKPPLIQADSRPVKVAPDNPGGKEFPHANKKIYERLGGNESDEVVKIKPRQEDVAAAATAAVTTPDATQPSQPSAAVPGGPRKVKTLTVRPDGTIEAATPQAPASATPGVVIGSDGTVAMRYPTPATTQPAQTQLAAGAPSQAPAAVPPGQPAVPAIPQPAAQPGSVPATTASTTPAPQQQAAVTPPAAIAPPPVQKPQVPAAPQQAAAQPAAASGSYVVQVAARKSQTDALAAFADIQQKYPRLLSGYRPIIKRADLGNKGVWYRLNVGPVESKQVASSLCGQLKNAGMRSCLVRAQ